MAARAFTLRNEALSYKAFTAANFVLMILIAAICVFPFIHLIAVSLSDATEVLSGRVSILPKGMNLDSYKIVLENPNFVTGYVNTILYTTVGTAVAMFMTVICAYALSKKYLPGNGLITRFIIFTMFFYGGLIPNFLLIRSLGFIDKIWAIVIPGAINTYNMILMRTFFRGIPDSLEEAAHMDGMNHIGILLRIYLPLSKPVLATIGLFYAVGHWNDWFTAFIYLNTQSKLPIMVFLRNILMGALNAAMSGDITQDLGRVSNVAATFKATSIVLATLPILAVYPFVQKYFVKGIMIGSLKG